MNAVAVVLDKEEPQVDEMHEVGLGERERLAHETRHPLAQCQVEPFDVIGLSFVFTTSPMLFSRQNGLISLPEVAVESASSVALGNLVPQSATGLLAAVTVMPGDHLSGSSAQGDPDPHLALLGANVRPQFV